MIHTLAAVLPLKQHPPTVGRRVILVDIENVIGGAALRRDTAIWARRQVESVLGVNVHDQVVIGASHVGFLNSALSWPHKQYVVKSGIDGADLALIDELEALRVDRYDEVVVVSGDGIFADPIAKLTAQGVSVTVVAHRGHCAARLRLAATRTLYLQPGHDHHSWGGAA